MVISEWINQWQVKGDLYSCNIVSYKITFLPIFYRHRTGTERQIFTFYNCLINSTLAPMLPMTFTLRCVCCAWELNLCGPLIQSSFWLGFWQGLECTSKSMTLADCSLTSFYLNMGPHFYRCNREGRRSPRAFTSSEVQDWEEKASVSG